MQALRQRSLSGGLKANMQPNRFTYAVLVLAALLAGCSTPPKELVAQGNTRAITSDLAPEAAYRRVVEGARTCYPKMDIGADFFQDNKSGRVALSLKPGSFIKAIFVADVGPAGPGSRVDVAHIKGMTLFADAVDQWLKGNFAACPGI